MEIKFVNPGVDYMVESVLAFQSEEESDFWSDPLYHFYPQIDKEYAMQLSAADRKKYVEKIIREIYGENEKILNEKAELYTKYWNKHKNQITCALSDAFQVDCSGIFNDFICDVSLNPISPRFLDENRFEVFYLNSEKGAIGSSLHEVIHFVWFYVWNKEFGDSYEEYERPSLKWIFSEMVVESTMRDERLSSINPYFPRENGGCIYPYFFTMQTSDGLAIDVLDRMYREKDIHSFMKDGYDWCKLHEDEIRLHIEKSEA